MSILSYRPSRFVPMLALILLLAFGSGAALAFPVIYGSAIPVNNPISTLYSISSVNGTATLIGPIGFGAVSALDFAPNGTLYGIGRNATGAFVLLTINTSTGAGTQVGPTGMNDNFQDITFRPSDGTLFGESAGNIYTINTSTGLATLVGPPNGGFFPDGNGLAFSSSNVLYLGSSANNIGIFQSFLQTINQVTGAATNVAPLTYSPLFGSTATTPRPNGMKFDAAGILWASVVNGFSPMNLNFLGTINIATGVVSFVGPTVMGLDAIAIRDVGTADAFQVRYFSNLNQGDSFINLTNTGASAGVGGLVGFTAGNICVNTYVFDQSEELLACCTCFVTPNGLASFSVKSQLINNNLTPEIPNSVVIKLLATAAGPAASASGCNASSPTTANLAPGLRAWGTTLHALPTTPPNYGVTETPFSISTLSQGELNHLTSFCGFIQFNGSGFGICKGCGVGGLGAATKQ